MQSDVSSDGGDDTLLQNNDNAEDTTSPSTSPLSNLDGSVMGSANSVPKQVVQGAMMSKVNN